jgi:hypothetical protein
MSDSAALLFLLVAFLGALAGFFRELANVIGRRRR